ncbi:MAG: coniferyl aldehyde dehydrogenase [Alphaproteobacteria bacterium]|nr:coniferyl aldehyde dehydrogenase [Alphaproteobacteria bacterium]
MGVVENVSNEGNVSGNAQMLAVLERQKQAHIREGAPSAELRIDRINRAIGLVVDYKDEICSALSADFGHRSTDQSIMSDVLGCLGGLKDAKKHLRKWMRPEKRSTMFPFNLTGAKSRVEYQPLGTVGLITPWNFPMAMTFSPLAGIFSAGNRVMMKPSEYTPRTAELLARMFSNAYDENEVAVFAGGPDVGQAFSALPFDHLIFIGATEVGKHIMRAAADNLVPVTLELGGKSPTIIGKSSSMQMAADRIMNGKMLNAGQICLAPDYVFVPKADEDAFVTSAKRSVASMYPSLKDNPDYTSVINQRHHDRLQGYISDARSKGARVVEINPADEDFSQQPAHKIPPTLVLDVSEDMKIAQEEIFGPLLMVKTYTGIDEVIEYVNAHPRPLALYYFGEDQAEKQRVLDKTTSGGVAVNDVMMHVAQEDLPFGGVGASGMGAYHGHDGFKNFSHAKAIFEQGGRFDLGRFMRPPFTPRLRKILTSQIKR